MKNSIIISTAIAGTVAPLLAFAITRFLYRKTIYATSGESKRNAFELFVQRLVAEQPAAPRTFSDGELLKMVLEKSDMKIMLGVGIGVFVVWLWLLWDQWENLRRGDSNALFGIFCVFVFYFLFAITPFIHYASTKQFLIQGTLADAKVLDVQYSSALDAINKTVAAGQYGMAIGHIEIPLGQKMVRKRFEIDTSWAQTIRAGSTMLVLLNPKNLQTMIFVGMKE